MTEGSISNGNSNGHDNGSASQADPRIVDLIKSANGEMFTSLEYFPPRTEAGVENLYNRMDRMKENLSPLFTDVTWGAGGSTADLSMRLSLRARETGHVANLHLTCTNMEKDGDPIKGVHDALRAAHDGGIRNIVALRGDPPHGQDEWKASEGGFTCALDLVKYITKHYGKSFGIAVAGYPEGHPNAISEVESLNDLSESEKKRCSNFDGKLYVCKDEDYKKEMDYLKEKIDAGSDLIMTQMFFDVEIFIQFVKDCRAFGITCPIIPGLMCINAYPGFKKMAQFCKTRVPKALEETMESLKDDAAAVKSFGVEYGAEVCQALIDFGVDGLHFYTLNLEKVVYGITDKLGITNGLIEKSNENDASSMVAVGSAWARVGDIVKCTYGTGMVTEIRTDGVTVVEMTKWVLAYGQKPRAYLQSGQFKKLFV
uniref:Methylenetetrahydrofolate reductase n=1 Tax=Eucampia antarctica TaxID=49252 RepID=A0A7S2W9Q8_9STRA